jgi:hypothetical protein
VDPKEKGRLQPSRGHVPARKIRAGSGYASGIQAHQIQQLLGTVPPAGHSHRLLSLWLERHALERRLQLQHHVGGLIDRRPACDRFASLAVDRATLRIDSITALLRYLAGAGGRGAL